MSGVLHVFGEEHSRPEEHLFSVKSTSSNALKAECPDVIQEDDEMLLAIELVIIILSVVLACSGDEPIALILQVVLIVVLLLDGCVFSRRPPEPVPNPSETVTVQPQPISTDDLIVDYQRLQRELQKRIDAQTRIIEEQQEELDKLKKRLGI